MRFWELTSAFRTETENLKTVFSKQCWKQYQNYYGNLETIIAKQDRKILDQEVPFQLAKEVCELSEQQFFLYYNHKPHRLTTREQGTAEDFEVVSPFDILVRFGGHYIEEILEKSISTVMPQQIGDNIEVLGVFKLTNIGILAFLRTETGPLKKDEVLCSIDEQRKWVIIDEPFVLPNPYTAYQKREHQIKQGIRLYKILPKNGSGKPKETEILKLELKKIV